VEDLIKLELTMNEANGILAHLGKLPYEQVFPLIEKIRQQGVPQAEAIVKAQEEAKAASEATPVEAA
jgi:hypothetical protein